MLVHACRPSRQACFFGGILAHPGAGDAADEKHPHKNRPLLDRECTPANTFVLLMILIPYT